MYRPRLALLAYSFLAGCIPPTPAPAPASDPILVARIDALESRQTQLLLTIARLEERLSAKVSAEGPAAARQEPASPQATLPAPAAVRQTPVSAPQRGPRGGCYVTTASGKKRYVSSERCN